MLIELKKANISVEDTTLLRDIDFHVGEGEFVYIIGRVWS